MPAPSGYGRAGRRGQGLGVSRTLIATGARGRSGGPQRWPQLAERQDMKAKTQHHEPRDLTGCVQYSGQIPWSITGRGIGDGWFPADTVLDEDVRDALRDGSLSVSGRRH